MWTQLIIKSSDRGDADDATMQNKSQSAFGFSHDLIFMSTNTNSNKNASKSNDVDDDGGCSTTSDK